MLEFGIRWAAGWGIPLKPSGFRVYGLGFRVQGLPEALRIEWLWR